MEVIKRCSPGGLGRGAHGKPCEAGKEQRYPHLGRSRRTISYVFECRISSRGLGLVELTQLKSRDPLLSEFKNKWSRTRILTRTHKVPSLCVFPLTISLEHTPRNDL